MSAASWTCPWCDTPALRRSKKKTVCECRECSCGAIGLSATVNDSDEIVDDAIGLFGVETLDSSRCFYDLLLADVVRSGIDVRGGKLDPVADELAGAGGGGCGFDGADVFEELLEGRVVAIGAAPEKRGVFAEGGGGGVMCGGALHRGCH